MDTILSASFLTALFASGVRQSIPLIYGSVSTAAAIWARFSALKYPPLK